MRGDLHLIFAQANALELLARNSRVCLPRTTGGVSGKPKTPLVSDTDEVRSGSSIRLNVLFEVAQNGLPALTLLLDGVRRLRVKCFAYRDAILPSYKLDQQY